MFPIGQIMVSVFCFAHIFYFCLICGPRFRLHFMSYCIALCGDTGLSWHCFWIQYIVNVSADLPLPHSAPFFPHMLHYPLVLRFHSCLLFCLHNWMFVLSLKIKKYISFNFDTFSGSNFSYFEHLIYLWIPWQAQQLACHLATVDKFG